MVSGIAFWIWFSVFVVWVAIALSYLTSGIEKMQQGHRNALGSLPAIFAHLDERGPVPGAQEGKKDEPGELKGAVLENKPIEIR
jgi:hypothetical protein